LPFAPDVKHYRATLQSVHSGADLDFMVPSSKWVLELAGDHATIKTLDEVIMTKF